MSALAPYRVLDLTSGGYSVGAKMLVDLGAEVLKIEPPGGDPGRKLGPTAHDSGDPNDSLRSWFYDRGKQSLVLDLSAEDDRARFRDLAAGADVVIESLGAGRLGELGLAPDELIRTNPRLVVTSVSPFGQTGPRSDFKGPDLVLAATSGMAWMCGEEERAPLRPTSVQFERHGGAEAAVATVIALFHASRTGAGQHVDVSAQLAAIRVLMNATGYPHCENRTLVRRGDKNAYSPLPFRLIYPCADGHVTFLTGGGVAHGPAVNHVMSLAAEVTDVPEHLRSLDWVEIDYSDVGGFDNLVDFADQVSEVLTGYFATRTKAELYADAIEYGWLLAPVNTPADLFDDEQLAFREFFDLVAHGADSFRYPGAWCKPTATPLVSTPRAPRIGQHSDSIAAQPKRTPAPVDLSSTSVDADRSVFDGLKVWDMAWVGVGPLTARYLGDHGATVVRLDSASRPDILRLGPPFLENHPGLNRSQFYADFNTSKRSIGLNMAREEARDVARELAEWADVVVESFTPKTLKAWGLDYGELSKLNPDLVMLSTCMQGQTGPRAGYRGFGQIMASLSGFYEITGWPDRDPTMVYGAYTDFICQRFCTTALVSALDHRARTGQGQHIDLAQYEAALQFLGPELLEHSVNGRIASRNGNHDPDMAPHGIYPTKPTTDRESWIAIAVETDEQWHTFRRLMGDPEWATDGSLATLAGRKAAEGEIDEAIAGWTQGLTSAQLVDLLQPEVAAGAVNDAYALFEEPQIAHRGFFHTFEHTEMGTVPSYNGMAHDLSRTPGRPRSAAPCVGEHSYEILSDVLHMDPDRIADLIANEAVEIT